jgi:hypothetical protein
MPKKGNNAEQAVTKLRQIDVTCPHRKEPSVRLETEGDPEDAEEAIRA